MRGWGMGRCVSRIACRGKNKGGSWDNKHFILWYIVSNKVLIMHCFDVVLTVNCFRGKFWRLYLYY